MTIKEKIMKIVSLALDINSPEIPEIGKKMTAVFFDWSPHCNSFSVSIFSNGWKNADFPDKYFHLYLCKEQSSEQLDEVILCLEALKRHLNEVSEPVENSEPIADADLVENSEPDADAELVENSEVIESKTALTPYEIDDLRDLLKTRILSSKSAISFLEKSSFYPSTISELVSSHEKIIENSNRILEKLTLLINCHPVDINKYGSPITGRGERQKPCHKQY